jgi:hypothetical protein
MKEVSSLRKEPIQIVPEEEMQKSVPKCIEKIQIAQVGFLTADKRRIITRYTGII